MSRGPGSEGIAVADLIPGTVKLTHLLLCQGSPSGCIPLVPSAPLIHGEEQRADRS